MDQRPMPLRKALELGQQIARGLAAAHEKGLTHRDLKPENIFITKDERAKILDFGLAKLRSPMASDTAITRDDHTLPMETKVGVVVGTVGYMSPEQVNGRPADPRSDIFALGVILWEILSGSRPFHGDSAVEIMHAILKDDPPELPADSPIPPSLVRTLMRCLEKDPRARFQSAEDLAFELENVMLGASSRTRPVLPGRLPRLGRSPWFAAAVVLAGAILMGMVVWRGREGWVRTPPTLHRLTYRTGEIHHARLSPDAQSFVYHLSSTGDPGQLWLGRVDGLGARSLELPPGTEVLSISSTGEMALRLPVPEAPEGTGTLARAPLGGGAPREVLENVRLADWGPDGQQLAVVRVGEHGRHRLEYPIGTVLFEAPAANGIECPRVSPGGDRVAFTEIVSAGNQALSVVDGAGRREVLARGEIQSLTWSPDGRELLYTLRMPDDRQELHTITLSGQKRLLYSVLGRLTIEDASLKGKVLLRHSMTRNHLFFGEAASGAERELSWLQSSKVADITASGKGLLFAEIREGAGPGGAYFRRTDGADAVRLGDGDPLVLSPDGKWALVTSTGAQGRALTLLPTGPGESRALPHSGVKAEWAAFLDPGRLLLGGAGADKVFRYYQQDLQTGAMKPWGKGAGHSEAYCLVAHDGSRVALGPVAGKVQLYSPSGDLIREISGMSGEEQLIQWSADGRELFIGALGRFPVKIWRLDLATGQRRLWKELKPTDTLGVARLDSICVAPDGHSYAYSFMRILASDLYLMEGWK
jgi:hypothetical protein